MSNRGIELTKAHRDLISREMNQSGHTQATLADACKTSQPTIGRILSGGKRPSWPMLTAICRVLGLTFCWDGKLTISVPS